MSAFSTAAPPNHSYSDGTGFFPSVTWFTLLYCCTGIGRVIVVYLSKKTANPVDKRADSDHVRADDVLNHKVKLLFILNLLTLKFRRSRLLLNTEKVEI